MPAPPTHPPRGTARPPTQPLWDVPASLTQPPGTDPGNSWTPGVPGNAISRSDATVPSAPPLPELEFSLDCILARDTRYTSKESQSHHPAAKHRNMATITALPTALPSPVSVWQKVNLAAMASGDYERAELIDVPTSGGWEPEDGTVAVYPVIRGNRTTPDKYTPFQQPVLSELHQLANMLFLASEAVTPFIYIKQLAKLMFTTVQYMVVKSA
ncbi:hypothetical protein DUI87_20264 [Hirundo rustica rustica]|uniref:Uncharacterized protein n=1 Tax=Hirundo rustica rustica TaxID=333673 RepID=A0A3M0JS63_HIRRU|nr:hypothetical protein DUI87_20264 [Hirundo rustica rustica]